MQIRILEDGVVVDNLSRKKGDLLEVEGDLAARLVKNGHAMHTVRVRCIVANTIIGNRVCAVGDEVEVAGEHAVALSNRGAVKIVSSLTPSLRERLIAYVAHTFRPTPGPHDGEPTVQVKIINPKGAFLCGRHHSPGDVINLPERVAIREVENKIVEFVGTPPRSRLDRPLPIELAPEIPLPTESYQEESPDEYPQHTVSEPHSIMPPTERGRSPERP